MVVSSTSYHGGKHLGEDELLEESASCPWCDGKRRRRIATLQREPLVTLQECLDCYASSASRMPSAVALSHYYRSYYDDRQFAEAGMKVTIGNAVHMGAHLARWIRGRAQGDALKVLDFGGGDGAVAAQAAEITLLREPALRRAEITVVDYQTVTYRPSHPAISVRHASELDDLKGEEFDFVIASAVLEHIPAPVPVYRRLLGMMRTGAGFYARTPYMAPILRLGARFGVKIDFTFPAHVHDLGQRFWEDRFARAEELGGYRLVVSQPSVVETAFHKSVTRTLVAHLLKLPWRLVGSRWKLVGGWEVFAERKG